MIKLSEYGVTDATLIYNNLLHSEEDEKDFILEGKAILSYPNGRLRMENQIAPSNGQKANYVLWCQKEFPSDVFIRWNFWPVKEPGLCMMFFSAKGREGQDLFDSSLNVRTGEYNQYHHGDINAFHVSYFRRKEQEERSFHTCNLRKSYGFFLTAQGGDPIPDVVDAKSPYEISILKRGSEIRFFINALEVFCFYDDGIQYGPLLKGGKIGFRQLAPMIAEYENLEVYRLGEPEKGSKKEFETMLLDMIEPLKKHYTKGKAGLELGVTVAGYGNKIAKMEGFSRILWGMVPYWAGGGLDESLITVYLEGLSNGTNPNSSEYWGDLHNKDQRMVEMAAISYGILMIPEKLWIPLELEVKYNLAAWLNQINKYTLAENNWQYFNVMVNLALKSVDMPYSKERMKMAMMNYESFYLEHGWYADGKRPQKDYYISFAIHYYCLMYSKFMIKEDPERCQLFRARAKEFAQTFLYWFDEEGKALPFGRSQTYRFAQVAFWSACVMTELDCLPLGVLKGLIERHLNYWLKQPIFDNGGILTVGYTYPNLLMSEGYNATGSPYWAFKAFAFLALPVEHEFWKIKSEPLPILKEVLAIPECDMIMQHRDFEVTALTAGQYPVMEHTHAAEKYAKFAYSSRFGFSIPRSYYRLDEVGSDSMLVFYVHNMYYVRRQCQEFRISECEVYSRWSPIEGIEVETWLIPTKTGHIRRHKISSQLACRAYDCGFSYPNCMEETIRIEEINQAIVRDSNGMSKVVSTKGTGKIIVCVPGVNLIFPNTCIPAIQYQIPIGNLEVETKVETEFVCGNIKIGEGNCYEVEKI